MKALTVKLLEPTHVETLRSLSRGLGRFIFAASVLIILFAGTFPFDFKFRMAYSTPFDLRLNQYDPWFTDRGQNILFFVPFGFGFASLIRTQFSRTQWRLALSPVASFFLSMIVESLQKFVSFRDPALMDLWTNTLGGTIGAALYVQFGDRLLAAGARGLLRLHRFATPVLVGGITFAFALFHLCAPLLLHDPGDLSVWDPDLPLVLGNEVGGDRPWNGMVQEVVLADHAASASEARRLAGGESPEQVFGAALLGHYVMNGSAPYPDQTGQLRALHWATQPATVPSDQIPRITPDHWMTTGEPITPAIRRIMASSELTMAARVITTSPDQRGPARMASISGGTRSRNIQIAQEFTDLVVRIRNAVRTAPELYVQRVLVPDQPHHVLVTNRAAETVVFVDGTERGRVRITPEAKVIWRLYPRAFRMRIEEYGFRSYAAIYRAMVFLPFAALLGATLMLTRLQPLHKTALAIAAVTLMAVLIELVLRSLGGKFEPINFAISLVLGFATLVGLLAWRRVRDAQE